MAQERCTCKPRREYRDKPTIPFCKTPGGAPGSVEIFMPGNDIPSDLCDPTVRAETFNFVFRSRRSCLGKQIIMTTLRKEQLPDQKDPIVTS